MVVQPKFIVFDGIDGSGKGTQLDMLKLALGEDTVVYTREPGGTELAESIRALCLSLTAKNIPPLTQFFLMWAARVESIQKKVLPALVSGRHVISDRSDSSTWAFQIYGENKHEFMDLFESIRKVVFCEEVVSPSLYIFFDLPPEVAHDRVRKDQSRVITHFDNRLIDYHARVREGFCSFSRLHKSVIVDANRTADVIHDEVKKIVLAEFAR